MKYLRAKALISLIVLILALGFLSLFVAIRESITMIEKKGQILENRPKETARPVKASGIPVSLGRTKGASIYFDGTEINDADAYLNSKNTLFVPIDAVFEKLGIGFNLLNADDILKADIKGKSLVIKLAGGSIYLDGEKLDMPQAAVTKNHIYVPHTLLNYINNLNVFEYMDMKSVFIDYYPGFSRNVNGNVKVLRLNNGKASISNILGTELYSSESIVSSKFDSFTPDPGSSSYILKTDGKIYKVDKDTGMPTYIEGVDPSAALSASGRYLYWVDKDDGKLNIYNKESGIKRKLNNYLAQIEPDGKKVYNQGSGWILGDFRAGKRYRRITFINRDLGSSYMFIERNGKVVVEGNATYSPDNCKILFYRQGRGYFTADSDGTDILSIGDGTEAKWINNDRILLTASDGKYIMDRNGRNRVKTENEWKMVGSTRDGAVFFTMANELYLEDNGIERKIADLPWECDWVHALSARGPYVMVSISENSVFYLLNGEFRNIGNYGLLPGTSSKSKADIDFENNILISPDNKKFVVMQKEGGFIALKVINSADGETNSILIDHSLDYNVQSSIPTPLWVSNGQLLLYTARKGWLVDFEKNVGIYSWAEEEGSTIEGVLP